MDKETNCIFCKIIKREIPSSTVYEDDKFFAFLDINPKSDGHTLLIPKNHYIWIQDTPDDVIKDIFVVAKRLIKELISLKKCEYVKLKVIGKDVPHFHIHLIPEYQESN